jgi:hypothetical protein
MKRLVVALGLAVLAAGLYIGPAQAGTDRHGRGDWHGRSVPVVDDDYPNHGRCRYGHATYPLIQDAVDDAEPGDLILVCPGTYAETVTVTKKLTIKGAKAGQDARWRDQTKESVITGEGHPHGGDPSGLVQLRSDNISWDGFLIRRNLLGPGMLTDQTFSGYCIRNTIFFENGIGLNLASDGEREVEMVNNSFTANNEFSQGVPEQKGAGYGIYSERGVADVLIADNLFERHNGGGILFADDPGDQRLQERVRVECNKSIHDNSFATFYATTDVQVVANTVRNEDPPSTYDASAIFIGARNRDILVKANRIKSANGTGIDVRDSGAPPNPASPPEDVAVLKNKVAKAKLHGIDIAATGTEQYEVRGNLAVRNGAVGIHVGAPIPEDGPAGAVLTRNTALDNGSEENGFLDCQDQTQDSGTEGTANHWEDNVGGSDQPDGICDLRPRDHDDGHHHGKHKRHKKRHHKKHPKYDKWCECPRTGRW